MSMFHILSTLSLLAAPAFAALATTTRYSDGQEGACGCGVNSAFSWQYEIAPGVYTAAGSQVLFDADNSSWCGAGCGVCYKLTNQGYSGCSTCGSTAGAGESIIVMVTNLCPHNGNEVWCPAVGATNNYGYGAHFDIMSTTLVNGTWDNPVVEYEQVTCPVAAMNDWAQCVCYDGIAPGTSSTSKPPSTSSTSSTHSSTSSSTKAVSTTSSTTTKAASTTAHTSTSTTSSHVSTSSSSSGSGLAALYGQCGGIGWTGPTACAVGTCVYNNDWYSQCLEGQGQVNILSTSSSTAPSCSTPASTSAAPLYGQCGGINWTGATTCAEGTCQYNNDWYSQCLPATGKRAARHHPKHIN